MTELRGRELTGSQLRPPISHPPFTIFPTTSKLKTMIIISKKAAESELEQMQVEICCLHLAVFA